MTTAVVTLVNSVLHPAGQTVACNRFFPVRLFSNKVSSMVVFNYGYRSFDSV